MVHFAEMQIKTESIPGADEEEDACCHRIWVPIEFVLIKIGTSLFYLYLNII